MSLCSNSKELEIADHASVRAARQVAGAPDQIHLALKDVLAAEGDLMMYASWPRCYDEVARGSRTQDQSGRP
jgi:hypothetical protein